MRDQLHIRNAEAAALARALAQQTGSSMSQVVLEALRQYRVPEPGGERGEGVRERRRLLEADWADRNERTFSLDDLYDPATGLPR